MERNEISSWKTLRLFISKNGIRLLISAWAVVLLVAQFVWPQLNFGPAALGLTVLAVLPWLPLIIESAKLPGGWELTFRAFREVEREQVRQREDLNIVLGFLLEHFVTQYELVHLRKLAPDEPFPFKKSNTFEAELRRLLALGLIERLPGKGIRSLFQAGDDVRNHLRITNRGKDYLKILDAQKDIPAADTSMNQSTNAGPNHL